MWMPEEGNVHWVRNKSQVFNEISQEEEQNHIARRRKLKLGLKLKWLVSIQWVCNELNIEFEINHLSVFNEIARRGKCTLSLK